MDPNRIKEALLNILSNAIQSIKDQGSIFIKTYTQTNFYVIEIRDTGYGIENKDMPFIFDPFFTTKKGGTGLGLAITHRIIEEHGGTIDAESKVGMGSLFRICLPLKEERELENVAKKGGKN